MKRYGMIAMIATFCIKASGQTLTIRDVLANGATDASNSQFRLSGTVGQTVIGSTMNASNRVLAGFWPIVGAFPVPVRANVRFLLSGAMNPVTQRMNKTLNTSGYLAARYGVPVHPDAVDSVTIEVRDALTGTGSTVRKFLPAWLLTDGSIRDFHDTTRTAVSADLPAGNYYIVVHHVNHLPVMSATQQALGPLSGVYDFTTSQSQAYGTNPMLPVGTLFGLFPGDGNHSNIISAADVNGVFGSLNATGYNASDINLSGIVTSADANMVLQNLNQAGQVP